MEFINRLRLTDLVAQRYYAGVLPGEQVAKNMIALRTRADIRWRCLRPVQTYKSVTLLKPQDLVTINASIYAFRRMVAVPWEFGKADRETKCESRVNSSNLQRTAQKFCGFVNAALAGFASRLTAGHSRAPLANNAAAVLEDWATVRLANPFITLSRRQPSWPLLAVDALSHGFDKRKQCT